MLRAPRQIPTTVIGTWYEHDVPVPDGTEFRTGAESDASVVGNSGRWFKDACERMRRGRGLGGSISRWHSRSGKTIYMSARASTGRRLRLRCWSQESSRQAARRTFRSGPAVDCAETLRIIAGQFRQLFVSALTKPADALSVRDPQSLTPTEYDRWFCSPYISSISYQIGQALPGTDVRAIRRVADTEGRILSRISTLLWIVTLAALMAAALAVAATSATTVLERRAEVGIMKAFGATNAGGGRDIFWRSN